ncbi:MAG: tetratricopeptide repeat protein [Acidobacteriota bacterium]|nr:MAG: tetratricopeptide repeat protein [Acidobacteriota bacterium]
MNKKTLWTVIVFILIIAAAAAWWAWKALAPLFPLPLEERTEVEREEEKFVIAVAPFWGPDETAMEKGRAMQRMAEKTLREELGAEEGVTISAAEDADEPPRTEEEAETLGEALQADIVVWGHVFMFQESMEIRPYLTTLTPLRWFREKERSVEVLFASPEQGGVEKTEVDELRNVALLVAAAYYQDMPDKALRLLQKIDPPTAESLRWQGNVYYILENWEEAEDLFEKSLALVSDERYGHLRPEDAVLLSDLGWVYYGQGRYEEALVKFQEAAELDPDDIEAHNGMGDIYHMQGRYEEATAELWKAVALEPENPDPHNSLGWVYADQSEFGAAISEFQKAIRLEPEHANAHSGLAWVYYHQEKYWEAIQEFQAPVLWDPESAEYRTAVDVEYDDVYVQLAYSLAVFETGREEEARAHVSNWGKTPEDAGWPAPLARFYIGEITEEKVLEATESDDEETDRRRKCEAYYYMGMAHLLGTGEPSDAPLPEREKKARELFEKCLATNATIIPEYQSAGRELERLH